MTEAGAEKKWIADMARAWYGPKSDHGILHTQERLDGVMDSSSVRVQVVGAHSHLVWREASADSIESALASLRRKLRADIVAARDQNYRNAAELTDLLVGVPT